MTHTYKISGMTCGGCRSHVEKVLNRIPEVSDAKVNLERGEAVIESEKKIPLPVFEKALAEDDSGYRISEK
ncbi:MAG TPA: heavy metal-associated domain-containing protein [Flavobacteriaceae bacterium]|nr:heavy metal-associated domain-containing protein [Flavobacteriaceae bacterium]